MGVSLATREDGLLDGGGEAAQIGTERLLESDNTCRQRQQPPERESHPVADRPGRLEHCQKSVVHPPEAKGQNRPGQGEQVISVEDPGQQQRF